jgi:hypothetical protein
MCLYFSISSPAVAKALRRAAEGKASAQAEAAEWKRRYELEKARNLPLEDKGFLIFFIMLFTTSFYDSYQTSRVYLLTPLSYNPPCNLSGPLHKLHYGPVGHVDTKFVLCKLFTLRNTNNNSMEKIFN